MSRFIVTDGSYFRPFSYDELVKPVAQTAEAHAAAADAYDQLSLETSALEQYLSENADDRQARALYDNYRQKLQSFQENLWNNGYNASTRRDMSAARNAYAKDITALKNAIQVRQERSKEYWDARHKNPDMVMGFDPGLSGLDNYLGNSEFGRDWYSYSGNQFASEVGAEAKARAAELLSSTANQSNIPGYLEYIQKEGFTNEQVNNAGILAQQMLAGQIAPDDPNIDPVEGLLANTLINRLQATGAMPGKNVSAEEFGRMFNYGMLGLAQGIGEVNKKLVDDKVYDNAVARANMRYKYNLEHPTLPDGSPYGTSYDVNRTVQNLTSGNAKKVENELYREMNKPYEKGPIVINTPDGTAQSISSWEDATKLLYYTPEREAIKRATGVDIALHPQDFWGKAQNIFTVTDKNGKEWNARTTRLSNKDAEQLGLASNNKFAVELQRSDGSWAIDRSLTPRINAAINEYNDYQDQMRKLNPGIDFKKIALSPREERKWREEHKISNDVGIEHFRNVVKAEAVDDEYRNATLADPLMGGLLENYAKIIDATYQKAANDAGGANKLGNTSNYIFYKVGRGGIDYSAKGEKNIKNVFDTDSKGNIDLKSLKEITALPQDIIAGAHGGSPKFRITTNKGTFVIDSALLGNNVRDLFSSPNAYGNASYADMVELLMEPVTKPGQFITKSANEKAMYYAIMQQALGSGNTPYVESLDELITPAVRKDIYAHVQDYIEAIFALPRDNMALRNFQMRGDAATKNTEPYINYFTAK